MEKVNQCNISVDCRGIKYTDMMSLMDAFSYTAKLKQAEHFTYKTIADMMNKHDKFGHSMFITGFSTQHNSERCPQGAISETCDDVLNTYQLGHR